MTHDTPTTAPHFKGTLYSAATRTSPNIYRVKLVGGPLDGWEPLTSNGTAYIKGHHYAPNDEGDVVYQPDFRA